MAQEFAEELRPIILELMLNEVEDENGKKIRGHGPTAVARKLNVLGIPTAREGTWHSGTVYRLMKRLKPELSEAFHIARDKLIEQYAKDINRRLEKINQIEDSIGLGQFGPVHEDT